MKLTTGPLCARTHRTALICFTYINKIMHCNAICNNAGFTQGQRRSLVKMWFMVFKCIVCYFKINEWLILTPDLLRQKRIFMYSTLPNWSASFLNGCPLNVTNNVVIIIPDDSTFFYKFYWKWYDSELKYLKHSEL